MENNNLNDAILILNKIINLLPNAGKMQQSIPRSMAAPKELTYEALYDELVKTDPAISKILVKNIFTYIKNQRMNMTNEFVQNSIMFKDFLELISLKNNQG